MVPGLGRGAEADALIVEILKPGQWPQARR